MTRGKKGMVAAAVICGLAWSAGAQQAPTGDPQQPAQPTEEKQSGDVRPAPPITEQPVDKYTPFSGGQEVSKDFPVSFPTDI